MITTLRELYFIVQQYKADHLFDSNSKRVHCSFKNNFIDKYIYFLIFKGDCTIRSIGYHYASCISTSSSCQMESLWKTRLSQDVGF